MTGHPGKEALRSVSDWSRNLEGGLASELRDVAAYVAELEAQVAEAREVINMREGVGKLVAEKSFLAHTAPKEDDHG